MWTPLPDGATFRHRGDARDGLERVRFARRNDGGTTVSGTSEGRDPGGDWAVSYRIELDDLGRTRSAVIDTEAAAGTAKTVIEGDGHGTWTIDGINRPDLAGCLDVDLEASGCTNAFPVRRLGLGLGQRADAPAVWVRARDGRAERLEQTYGRLLRPHGPSEDPTSTPATASDDAELDPPAAARFAYSAPGLDFHAVITYDSAGVVLRYPGIAVRLR